MPNRQATRGRWCGPRWRCPAACLKGACERGSRSEERAHVVVPPRPFERRDVLKPPGVVYVANTRELASAHRKQHAAREWRELAVPHRAVALAYDADPKTAGGEGCEPRIERPVGRDRVDRLDHRRALELGWAARGGLEPRRAADAHGKLRQDLATFHGKARIDQLLACEHDAEHRFDCE